MVAWTDNTENKYICSKCLNPPKYSEEVLKGCTNCGNKLFKLKSKIDSQREINYEKPTKRTEENAELTQVSTISIPKNGIFEIDVDSLFKKKGPEPIAIVDKKGKIYLNL